jgi:hypothetical protein
MKHEIKNDVPEFKPVTINLTFEKKEELADFVARLATSKDDLREGATFEYDAEPLNVEYDDHLSFELYKDISKLWIAHYNVWE